MLFWVFPNRPFILGTLPISSGNRACISFAWDLPDICLPKTQPRSKPAGQRIKKIKIKNKKETERKQVPEINSRIYYSRLTRLTRLTQNQKKKPPCHAWTGSISLLHIFSLRTNRSTSWYLVMQVPNGECSKSKALFFCSSPPPSTAATTHSLPDRHLTLSKFFHAILSSSLWPSTVPP